MAKDEKEEKKSKERFGLGSIATETETIIVDNETNEQYTVQSALMNILNSLEKLKKLL